MQTSANAQNQQSKTILYERIILLAHMVRQLNGLYWRKPRMGDKSPMKCNPRYSPLTNHQTTFAYANNVRLNRLVSRQCFVYGAGNYLLTYLRPSTPAESSIGWITCILSNTCIRKVHQVLLILVNELWCDVQK